MAQAHARPDPERHRRIIGAAIYVFFMLAGGAALVVLFLLTPLASRHPEVQYQAMGIGAACALPPLAIYLWIPRFIDRYDPEPWWALALVLGWGAIAACGVAATVNTTVAALVSAVAGPDVGDAFGACVCAPIVEEGMKGVAVFGVFYFLRREFDGVVDGVIYATFAALGFAAVENIVYYSNAVRTHSLESTFWLRGVLAPWGHPLYTSMTGLGFGIARETRKPWLRWVAPLGGYGCAMFLHSVWNTAATVSGYLMLVMLPLWLAFVGAFIGILIWLVARKGRIIRAHLEDEVLIGTMTRDELAFVVSPFSSFRASKWGGDAGRDFVRAASRLALSKWHAGRAYAGKARTVSADFIVPLRQDLARLRTAMSRALGRQLPMPQPWTAPGPQRPGPQAHAGQAHPQGYPQQQPYPQQPYPQQPYPQQQPYPAAQPYPQQPPYPHPQPYPAPPAYPATPAPFGQPHHGAPPPQYGAPAPFAGQPQRPAPQYGAPPQPYPQAPHPAPSPYAAPPLQGGHPQHPAQNPHGAPPRGQQQPAPPQNPNGPQLPDPQDPRRRQS